MVQESPITFVQCKRCIEECECSEERFSLRTSARNPETVQGQIPNSRKVVPLLPILLPLLLPGTRIYILSGLGHFPSASACWAKGSNGQREHCLVRHLGTNCFSLVGHCLLRGRGRGPEGRSRGQAWAAKDRRAQPPWLEANRTRMWWVANGIWQRVPASRVH